MPVTEGQTDMSSELSAADLAVARVIGAMLPRLEHTDLVFALLPDGEEYLVKGRTRLGQIIASQRAAQVSQAKVPVPDIDAAVALEQALGSDGNLERNHFGNILYRTSGTA